jgi:hypothetical protein
LVDVLELVMVMFRMVLPWMLVAVAVPTCAKMARRTSVAVPLSEMVIGPPPQLGAVPPIKFPVKLRPVTVEAVVGLIPIGE